MPIHYELDATSGRVRTRCVGYVDLREVMEHFRTLERDPRLPPRLDVLLDLRETESLPESQHMQTVANHVGRLGESRLQWGACAIIASSDALYGMSRVFQVFAEAHFERCRVFREPAEAEAWLGASVSARA